MNLSAALSTVNFWAVLAAALSSFVIGGLWYSPLLFHKAWMRGAGVTEAQMQDRHTGMVFGVSFVLQLLAALVLAMFLGPMSNLGFGALAGLMVGLAWVATAFGVIYLFERRSLLLFLVNAGYLVVTFTVMGTIIGAWH